MADTTIFMSFEGIDGEAAPAAGLSNAPAGGAWINLSTCRLNGNAGGSYGSGTTVVKGDPIVVTKPLDAATVPLLDAFLRNKPTKNVVITHARTGEGGMVEYLRYELTDAQIISFGQEGGDAAPSERLEIVFGSVEIISWDHDNTAQRAPVSFLVSNAV